MYLSIKKSNFQYECAIKLYQHVLNEEVHSIQKETIIFGTPTIL
jgi:hypothetical protein